MTRRLSVVAAATVVAAGVYGAIAAILQVVASPATRLALAGPLDSARPLLGSHSPVPADTPTVALAWAGARLDFADAPRFTPALGLVLLAGTAAIACQLAGRSLDPGAGRGARTVVALQVTALGVLALVLAAAAHGGVGGHPVALAALAAVSAPAAAAGSLLWALASRCAVVRLLLAIGAPWVVVATVWIAAGAAVSTALAYAPNVLVDWIGLSLGASTAVAAPVPVRTPGRLDLLHLPGSMPAWQRTVLLISAAAMLLAALAALAAGAGGRMRRGARGAALGLVLGLLEALLGFQDSGAPVGPGASSALWHGVVVLAAIGVLASLVAEAAPSAEVAAA